jgi:hypothetical protein
MVPVGHLDDSEQPGDPVQILWQNRPAWPSHESESMPGIKGQALSSSVG